MSRRHLHSPAEAAPIGRADRDDAGAVTRVLYIAGWGRSGSTLVEGMLDQLPDLVGIGEVKFLWERGLTQNRRCSCGTPLRSCEFWTEVLHRAYGAVPGPERIAALHAASNRFRTRHLPRLLIPARIPRQVPDLGGYYSALGRLYRAVRMVSGARVVVDSSKFPSYLAALLNTPGLDIRVAHIIRDPRAVAFSWQRHKPDPDAPGDGMMPRLHPGATAMYWSAWNLATERLVRSAAVPYSRIRYEDVVADPAGALTAVTDLAGLPRNPPPLTGDDEAVLAPTHQVSGNPVRFRTGTTPLRLDNEWESGLNPAARRLTATLTLPLRRRYGYK